ncbi:MAG: 2-phospho-L-lactate transferase [Chloroflexota bacterium]|nr:MAG: 2-phospho-L-lactate transferase [Chloroflexota bacterium]
MNLDSTPDAERTLATILGRREINLDKLDKLTRHWARLRVVALAGGVGGAKMAYGLYQILSPGALTVVVNTGDDLDRYGLYISPDLDTIMYTLAGLASRTQGWGIENDSRACLSMLERYGQETWFGLGDRDLATHLLRTQLLASGLSLTECTRRLASALGIQAEILPMCDEPVRTIVQTVSGELPFQEYFVKRQAQDHVLGLRYAGSEQATMTADAREAIARADLIVLCPSNPLLSIEPILCVPGMREALSSASAPRIAITPIVGGKALRGPAADLMRDLGYGPSAAGVAAYYGQLLDGFVLDVTDSELQLEIRAQGIKDMITDTVMKTDFDRIRLSQLVLQFRDELCEGRA